MKNQPKFCYTPFFNDTSHKAVSQRGKYWEQNKTINIFLGDPTHEKDHELFIAALDEIFKYINLNYKITGRLESDIRVGFVYGAGSFSYVGVDALLIPNNEYTLNIGWFSDNKSVQIHEILHALGLLHEHQNPTSTIQWNRAQVIEDLSGPPNYWTVDTIERNVLNALDPSTVNYTSFDRDSIMLYFFPDSWTLDGNGTKQNNTLSKTDIEHIQKLYPKKSTVDPNIKTEIQKYCKVMKYFPKGILKLLANIVGVEDVSGTKAQIISKICQK